MKKNVKIIVGLPASGKTTYCKKIVNKGEILFDDPISIPDTIKHIADSNYKNFILTHPVLCETSELDFLIQDLKMLGVSFEIFYFENNKEQCLKNDQKRGSLSQVDILYFSSIYFPPNNGKLISVFNTQP